jgi:hypothetical protein
MTVESAFTPSCKIFFIVLFGTVITKQKNISLPAHCTERLELSFPLSLKAPPAYWKEGGGGPTAVHIGKCRSLKCSHLHE